MTKKINNDIIVNGAILHDCFWVIDTQIENHKSSLTKEQQKDGYVTLLTPFSFLQKFNYKKHLLIARRTTGDTAGIPAGYLMWVDRHVAHENQFLAKFSNHLNFKEHLSDFVIVAQIALSRTGIKKRKGIGTELYNHFFDSIVPDLSCKVVVTEVSEENQPSFLFHIKMGFTELSRYTDEFGNTMIIVGKKVNQEKENSHD